MNNSMGPVSLSVTEAATGERVIRSLASAVYERLRSDVLCCRYGPGEKLLIAPLARGFGVSASSVREALSRLVADGLVVVEDQRGFTVSALSLSDLEDVTKTRIELECLALRRSILRADNGWRRALKVAWRELDEAPHFASHDELTHHEIWSQKHERFHAALVSACELGWLLRFRQTLYEQSERYRRISLRLIGKSRDTRGEHRRIFEATIKGDPDRATKELSDHFMRTATMIMAAYSGLESSKTLQSPKSEKSE
jgi:DNA-binding GntR family transcriptional regulator